jgi:integrase
VVTLPAVALEAPAEHLDRHALPGPDGLVFTSSTETYILRSNFSRWVWRPAVHRLGLDGLRFHDLRHTAGTLAAVAGATTKELMERIGHTSPGVAMRYQHVMADRLVTWMNRWSGRGESNPHRELGKHWASAHRRAMMQAKGCGG